MNANLMFAVAAGGALGSVARYLSMIAAGAWLGAAFPWGTLIVNALGSALMGLIIEGSALRWNIGPDWRAFLTVGVLGGFTTFSTFSLDVAVLIERNELLNAALYIAASVLASVGALFAAMLLVRQVMA
ncbi:putative fluoride ion transporter CrcB [Rhodospirillaceae bacterium LM-1]|nr:putative fluoride ion transporter CrcB [Rhodospirillaceae bacterium LM-1]